MRLSLGILVLYLVTAGCDLTGDEVTSVDEHQLAGTAWKVESSSEPGLLPPQTRMSFDDDRRFTSDQYRCGRWRIEDRLLVVENSTGDPHLIARLETVSGDSLQLTLQPRESFPSVQAVLTPGGHPQTHFEQQGRSLPDLTITRDTLGRYVTEEGTNWEIWKMSPLYDCGRYFVGLPSPNPASDDTVSVPIGHVDRFGPNRIGSMVDIDPDRLTLKGYDYTGALITLDEEPERQRFVFDLSRLTGPDDADNEPRLYRLLVVNDDEQLIAFGNLLVE